jgi:protein subunit release factor A
MSRVAEKMKGKQTKSANQKRRQDLGNKGRGSRVRVYDFLRGVVNDERIKSDFPIKLIMKGGLDRIYKKCKNL